MFNLTQAKTLALGIEADVVAVHAALEANDLESAKIAFSELHTKLGVADAAAHKVYKAIAGIFGQSMTGPQTLSGGTPKD